MSLNLGTVVSGSAHLNSGRTALIFDDETLNYEELDSLIRRFAFNLKVGDRVALMVPNGPSFTIAYFFSVCGWCGGDHEHFTVS